jgi:glycosidase
MPEQPDLDWRNPDARDGDAGRRPLLARPRASTAFRLDAVNVIVKDASCATTPHLPPEPSRCR